MEREGECSVSPFHPEARVPGLMYVCGYIMHFSDDGSRGIMSVKGGGGKFILFDRDTLYLNGRQFFSNISLYDTLQKGLVMHVLMHDVGEYVILSTFRVRYEAVLSWVGSMPYVPPFIVEHPALLLSTKSNENTPPNLDTYDIMIDVNIAELTEYCGVVYWSCDHYGLVSVKINHNSIINVLFTPEVMYLNGVQFPEGENFVVVAAEKTLSMYTKKIPRRAVFGVSVSHEAVLVWRGLKPKFRLIHKPPTTTYGKPVLNPVRQASPNVDTEVNPALSSATSNGRKVLLHKPQHENSNKPQTMISSRLQNVNANISQNDNTGKRQDANSNKPQAALNKPQAALNNKPQTALNNKSQAAVNKPQAAVNNKPQVALNNKPQVSLNKQITTTSTATDASEIISASYFTGNYNGVFSGYFIYGSIEKACRFSIKNFFEDDTEFVSMAEMSSFIMSSTRNPILHGYVKSLNRSIRYDKYNVSWEGLYVWHGTAPSQLKEKIRALKKEPLSTVSTSSSGVTRKKVEVESMVDRVDLVGTENIAIARPIKRGRVSGYVLSCCSSDAIVTGFTNSVYFTRERFYVNGRKFRGISLLDYFQKNNEKVFTYLVPMKATKVRGCMVSSRAVCAWIGKEPDDLRRLIVDNRKMTNHEITPSERNEKGCFYYFVGRVHKLGETRGVMQCDIEGQHLNVSFSVDEIYKNGKKINGNNILAIHLHVLMSSRWSVLAYYTDKPTMPGVPYVAVAVWHHENQLVMFDEFQNKIPLWQRKLTNAVCECKPRLDKLLTKAYSSIERGSITEKRETELAIGVKDRGLVWLDRNRVWVDGCSCYFSESDEQRVCFVVLGEDEETPLFAWVGKQPDIKNHRCGNSLRQSTLGDKDSDDDDGDDGEHNDEKYFEDVYEDTDSDSSSSDSDKENGIDLTDVADPYDLIQIVTKNSFAALVRNKPHKLRQSKNKGTDMRNFCGRHIVGNIESITDNDAILSWRSVEYSGTIFIVLDVKYLFINTVAYSKGNFNVSGVHKSLKEKVCNLYINTMSEPSTYGLLEVCARATAGWIGTKPVFVPPPGKQKPGIFESKQLRIAYSESASARLKFCSLENWKLRLKKEKLKQQEREKKEQEDLRNQKDQERLLKLARDFQSQNTSYRARTPDTLPSDYSSLQHLSSLHLADSNPGQTTTLSQATIVTSQQVLETMCPSYTTVASVSASQVNSEHNYFSRKGQRTSLGGNPRPLVSNNTSQDTPVPSFTRPIVSDAPTGGGSTAVDGSMLGKVVELHQSIGRLVGSDGSSHYFKPEQFLLYGVSLKGVEMYSVLVQDLMVQYSLDAAGHLEHAWYGRRSSPSQDETAIHILQWCADNMVPEDTQSVLIAAVARL